MTALVITPDNLPQCSIYILLEWPYWNELISQPWFDTDCIQYEAKEHQVQMACAYFIPMERFAEAINQGLIALQV